MRNTSKRATRNDWDPEDVKAAVHKVPGGSFAALARDHGYTASAFSVALRQPWPAVEAIIARFLGLAPWEVWPSRYTKRTPNTRPWRRRSERAA